MSNNVPNRYWPFQIEAELVLTDLRSLQLKMKQMGDKLTNEDCPTPAKRYLDGVKNISNAINALKK